MADEPNSDLIERVSRVIHAARYAKADEPTAVDEFIAHGLADAGLLADPGVREELDEWREAAAAGGKEWLVTRVRAALGTPEGRSARMHALEVRAERDQLASLCRSYEAQVKAVRACTCNNNGIECDHEAARGIAESERDALQARIDAAVKLSQHQIQEVIETVAEAKFPADILAVLLPGGEPSEDARAALQGAQPTGEADRG